MSSITAELIASVIIRRIMFRSLFLSLSIFGRTYRLPSTLVDIKYQTMFAALNKNNLIDPVPKSDKSRLIASRAGDAAHAAPGRGGGGGGGAHRRAGPVARAAPAGNRLHPHLPRPRPAAPAGVARAGHPAAPPLHIRPDR